MATLHLHVMPITRLAQQPLGHLKNLHAFSLMLPYTLYIELSWAAWFQGFQVNSCTCRIL